MARRFQEFYEQPSVETYAQVAEYFGVARPVVSVHVALLKGLPRDFVEWIDGVDDPEVLSRLSMRKMVAVARIGDPEEQRREIAALIEELGGRLLGLQLEV